MKYAVLASAAALACAFLASPVLAKDGLPATAGTINLDPLNLAGAISPTSGVTSGLGNVVGPLVTWLTSDFAGAAALAVSIPSLQDGNGQACALAAKPVADVIKAHPLPISGMLATDIEAQRLFIAALDLVCASDACNRVWTDESNAIAQIGLGVPVPALSAICAKIPVIRMVAPVATAPVTAQ